MRVPRSFLFGLSKRTKDSTQPTLEPSPEIRRFGNEVSELTGDAQKVHSIIDGIDNFKKDQCLDIKGGFPVQNSENSSSSLLDSLKKITPKTRMVAGATVVAGGLTAALGGLISKFKRKKTIKERILDTLGYN